MWADEQCELNLFEPATDWSSRYDGPILLYAQKGKANSPQMQNRLILRINCLSGALAGRTPHDNRPASPNSTRRDFIHLTKYDGSKISRLIFHDILSKTFSLVLRSEAPAMRCGSQRCYQLGYDRVLFESSHREAHFLVQCVTNLNRIQSF